MKLQTRADKLPERLWIFSRVLDDHILLPLGFGERGVKGGKEAGSEVKTDFEAWKESRQKKERGK